jgi:uncharacterized protein YndB with AHSA1/START domain
MTDRGVITVDQYLAHPPASVWAALTDPDLAARWLVPNDFKARRRHRFTVWTKPRPGRGPGPRPG